MEEEHPVFISGNIIGVIKNLNFDRKFVEATVIRKEPTASFSIDAVGIPWRHRLRLIWMLLRHGKFSFSGYGVQQ